MIKLESKAKQMLIMQKFSHPLFTVKTYCMWIKLILTEIYLSFTQSKNH